MWYFKTLIIMNKKEEQIVNWLYGKKNPKKDIYDAEKKVIDMISQDSKFDIPVIYSRSQEPDSETQMIRFLYEGKTVGIEKIYYFPEKRYEIKFYV